MSKFYVSEYKTVSKCGIGIGESISGWTQRKFSSKKERDFFFEDRFYSLEWYNSLLTKFKQTLKNDDLKLLVARKDSVWEKAFDSRAWTKGMKNSLKSTKKNEKFVVKSPSEYSAYTYDNPKEAWERMKKILPNNSTIYSVVYDIFVA
jgi:hypothetical protein